MNKRGANTILTIIFTAIITALICYIVFKFVTFKKEIDGVIDDTYKPSEYVSNLDISPDKMALFTKMNKLKNIIDEDYLYEYDSGDMLDGLALGMLASLNDPYAAYYNEEHFKSFYTQTEGEYTGIGIYVGFDKNKSLPIILLPIEGSPAEKAGLLPGDYIEYVDEIYADDSNYETLIDSIQGPIGETVKIGIIRYDDDKKEEKLEIKVKRDKIELNPVTSKTFENDIGYIRLSSFDETTYTNFKEKYESLIKDNKIKGLIIDVRDNPGGVLSICTQITDMLVPKGKIVYTVNKKGTESAVYSDSNQIEIPLVVLINENSASASEVFSGAIKDYKVGTLIGKKTYGKGVVQTLKSLRDGTYIKITTEEYFSPLGNKIDSEGVTPDIEVDLPEDVKSTFYLDLEKDTQLQRAIEEIKSKI